MSLNFNDDNLLIEVHHLYFNYKHLVLFKHMFVGINYEKILSEHKKNAIYQHSSESEVHFLQTFTQNYSFRHANTRTNYYIMYSIGIINLVIKRFKFH